MASKPVDLNDASQGFPNARSNFGELYDRQGSEALAYAATITPIFVDKAKHKQIAALTGALTIANPAVIPDAGTRCSVGLLQDGTGGRAVTWGSAYKFPSAWSNTGNTLGLRSIASFVSDGTYLWARGLNSWA